MIFSSLDEDSSELLELSKEELVMDDELVGYACGSFSNSSIESVVCEQAESKAIKINNKKCFRNFITNYSLKIEVSRIHKRNRICFKGVFVKYECNACQKVHPLLWSEIHSAKIF